MPTLYEIAVDAPLPGTLTYGQPKDRDDPLAPGTVVLVPLGRRKVTGYVLGPAAPADSDRPGFTVRPIADVLTASPFFPADLVPFYRWIARYYLHPIGEVIRTALPSAPGSRSGRRVVLTAAGRTTLTPAWIAAEGGQAPWLEQLADSGSLEPATVQRLWRDPAHRALVQRLEHQGLVQVDEVLRTSGARARTRPVLVPGPDLPAASHPDPVATLLERGGERLRASEQRVLTLFFELYRQGGLRPVDRARLGDGYAGYLPPLRRLLDRGLLVEHLERVHRDPFGAPPAWCPAPERLTGEQEQVLAVLRPAIAARNFAPLLLHGVTGCGKTEVYLQAVRHCLDQGQTALALVPEIALAAQLEAHFHSRFGDLLAVLHSGLGDGERLDQWQRVLSGQARVVLGARSAVFAPLEQVGLIIVDEEHEPAYKQDDGLRYHGRDLAVLRARQAGCPVLLGSATPSVVSYHHAREGKYTLLTMHKRVEARPLPAVEIVDLARCERSRPDLTFSDRLITALRATLEARQQSLLFVNRRGFSSFMLCRDCGHILQCRHCQVSLTLHRSRRTLLCHYCGYTRHPDVLCPACGSTRVSGFGIGSERIEEEVLQLFPEARVARLDSDTSANRRHYLAILKAVRDREIDILIGTQMIAKGLHFPHITLVGVVWADSGLGMPDYKAAERTFSLLAQVTGRAGRGEHPGRVIVQTHQPHHYAVRLAEQHDYAAFFAAEIAVRRPLGYPPFSRLVNLRFSGVREEQVQEAAQRTAAFLRAAAGERSRIEILGPSPAPLARIKDRSRWQLLLKSGSYQELHALCERLQAERGRLFAQAVTMHVDVDPENMM